ncbi:hypothetical protein [Agathobaculum sp. Marseille-P7918]|uniref:hypothetical protein n=1 Tax=Agathobaculum sp. Marseille-P7918 TaxID=2479843 RepID=UPI000F63F027|nr:hypothetical protein [Agathobaculum sp. Marseille-P7918]
MSLSDQKLTGFSKKITQLADQPNMQPQELKAYFDSSPEELRQAHNGLCDALCASDAAAGLGFARSAGVPADTVQAAVENVQQQVRDAVVGSIPSGSVDGDKLAQDVRDRFAAIESAAANEASARASADSQMQSLLSTHTSQIAQKCEVYIGTYTGDGSEERTIPLGFTPKAVLLMTTCGYSAFEFGFAKYMYGGFATANVPVQFSYEDSIYTVVKIVNNGFQVFKGSTDDGKNYVQSNLNSYQFVYLAFK